MSQNAYLFLNGTYADEEPWVESARGQGLVIGVDGGANYLLAINLQPDIVIGDMDSLSKIQCQKLKAGGAQIILHPVKKDETDFELALNYAILHDYKNIMVFGAMGGRTDHMLANILLPSKYLCGTSISLFHGNEELFFISSNMVIKGSTGDMLSLVPIAGDVTNVTTKGLRYPLTGETLLFGKTRGISNEMLADEAGVSITSGLLLCIHTHRMIMDNVERGLDE
jgi:thiamine pyrophosphokinase